MSNQEIVEIVYLEILERPADKAGLDHWVSRMDNPDDPLNTKEELIAIFKQSSEYKNLSPEPDADPIIKFCLIVPVATGKAKEYANFVQQISINLFGTASDVAKVGSLASADGNTVISYGEDKVSTIIPLFYILNQIATNYDESDPMQVTLKPIWDMIAPAEAEGRFAKDYFTNNIPAEALEQIKALRPGAEHKVVYEAELDKIHEKAVRDLITNVSDKMSIYQEGMSDTWLNNSGDSHGTRYIPSNYFRPATVGSVEVQKLSGKYPAIVGGQTMNAVSDENSIFILLSEGTGGAIGYNNTNWGTGPGKLVKIDKQSGAILNYRDPVDIFQSTDPEANVVTRAAPSLLGDYVYLTSSGIAGGAAAVLAKLKKSDLSTVWTINCLKPEELSEVKNIRDCLAFEHNGKILIAVDIATTMQYGGRGGAQDYKHNFGHFKTQGGALCIQDNGDSATKLWEWNVGPKILVEGDKVPDEAFIDGQNEMHIIYPIVNLDGSDSSNYVNSAGVKGFKVDVNTAGTVTLDLLTITGDQGETAQTLGDVGDIKAQGTYTFKAGDIILDSSAQIFECDGVLADKGTKVLIPGSHIFRGQTLIKKIQKGRATTLDQFEAYNMNYYGSGSYAPISFDEKLGRVLITTANGHAQPYEDGLQLTTDLNIADLTQKYSFAIRDLYKGLKTAEQVQEVFKEYNDAVMKRKNLPKSPRWRRFLPDAVVCLDALTGEMYWADGASSYDPFTWQEDKQPQWRSILRGNNGDIVTGATLITLDDGTRRIHSGRKSAFNIMHYPDAGYSITAVPGDSKATNYANGIKSMNMLYGTSNAPVYETVGACGNQGGAMFGACSNGDAPGAIYVTHQINCPFGSHILRQLGDGPNKDVPELQGGFGDITANLGFISDKVVENDQGPCKVVRNAAGNDTGKRLIPFATGYLVATDAKTGKTRWICPLSSSTEANQEFLAPDSTELLPGDSGIPVISDQGPPSMFGSVVIVGMASGKVHYVDGRNGKMLHTQAFPCGAAGGISGTRDQLFLQTGWNKWGMGTNPQAEHMHFLTCNGN